MKKCTSISFVALSDSTDGLLLLFPIQIARGGWGTNEHMIAPCNPWSTEGTQLTCGGSSSGSGASVSSYTVPCAVGTDTGGSVRTPAALCGIVGLKTTKGMLPTDGIVPLSHSFDTPGPMARSVADCTIMCAAMMEPEEGKKFEIAFKESIQEGVKGLRFACIGEKCRKLIQVEAQLAAFDAALEVLAGLGAEIVEFDWDVTAFLTNNMSKAEGYFHHKAVVDDPDSEMDRGVRERLKDGKDVTVQEYIECDLGRELALGKWLEGMKDCVAWLSPTTASLPISLKEAVIDLTETKRKAGPFTRFVNYCGLCAISGNFLCYLQTKRSE